MGVLIGFAERELVSMMRSSMSDAVPVGFWREWRGTVFQSSMGSIRAFPIEATAPAWC